jgi:hypothetical protein
MTRRELLLGLLAAAAGRAAVGAQPQVRPAIRPARLNHIAFFASDVKSTVEWYQRFFGLPVQFRPDGAILRLGEGPEFIAIYPANDAKPGFKHTSAASGRRKATDGFWRARLLSRTN